MGRVCTCTMAYTAPRSAADDAVGELLGLDERGRGCPTSVQHVAVEGDGEAPREMAMGGGTGRREVEGQVMAANQREAPRA